MPTVIASVVQACTAAYGDPDSLTLTLEKLKRLTAIAKERDGSQLVVFPEAFIGGYPSGSHFGAVIGSRTAEGRQEYVNYYKGAIEIPSAATRAIEGVASTYGVFLVVGVIERAGGTLYCTIIFVHPEHGYVAKHRKLMPTAVERLVWGMGDATTLPVLDVTLPSANAKLSATICWENYMPLLRTYYYSQGVQIYCAPTVDSRDVWQHTMAHIALEGRCHVLSACQFAQQKDYSETHLAATEIERDSEGILIAGGSAIFDPQGQILAGPLRGEEGVLTAVLDLDDQIRGKYDLDCVGHYARNDVFELVFKGPQ